jgi:3-dehydroquinate dehydratase type I
MADRHRMLAVAFGPPTMGAALAGLAQIRDQADCVELRLDLFEEAYDLPALMRERGDLVVVATLRPPSEGGKSPLPAHERLKVLQSAAELGAGYVDLEWDAVTTEALASLHAAGAQVVVSRHDFSTMPPELVDGWYPRLAELGADVVKVVATAHDVRECLPVLRVLRKADRPTISIAMGEAGLLSRVLVLREERCLLTYAALEDGTGTAPGQLTLRDMRETYGAQRLGSSTRVYGLLGPHAEAERSRLVAYNAGFMRGGFDGVAVPVAAASEGASIISAFRELPVSGWHIHGPQLQLEALAALDEVAPTAARQGKVNAINRRANGALVGHWVETPREQYELWLHSDG